MAQQLYDRLVHTMIATIASKTIPNDSLAWQDGKQ
jgi:hypothetical protein